jgi:transposase
MPRPSGDRVKTDGRDAAFLARTPAVGNVAEAAVPTPEMEAARDPVRARLDAAIAERAKAPDLAPVVPALSRIRGISTVTAFSIAAEVGDFARFPDARPFMP